MGNWVVAKYIRLSQADRDLGSHQKQESDSISHQRDMLETFIAGHSDLAKCEQMEFIDDGFSGTAFDRPGFEKLLDKIRKQEVTCVIVKDFSRFGRDYIELGDYLERIFPLLGVRFISVNDHYDSLDYKGTTGGLDVVMKNIVYAYYSRDLSVKIKTAKRAKMKRGELVSGHAPYGYKIDPKNKHKMILDPIAAEVVREIYDSFLAGMRYYAIADMLNQKGIDTPAVHYQRNHPGNQLHKRYVKNALWSIKAIKDILQNKVYYGAYVGHKIEVGEVGSGKDFWVPEDERIVIEDHHEPIITKDAFHAAQEKILKTGRKPGPPIHYPLRKKVICGTCGRACRRMLKNPVLNPHQVYLCQYSRRQIEGVAYEGTGCTWDDIDETLLEEIVWNAIQKLFDLAGEAEKRISAGQSKAEQNQKVLAKMLSKAVKAKENSDEEQMQVMEEFLMKKITLEEYQRKKLKLSLRIEEIEKEIRNLKEQIEVTKTLLNGGLDRDLEKVKEYAGTEKLTEEIVGAFVDKVLLYDKEHIEIRWRFSKEFLEVVGVE